MTINEDYKTGLEFPNVSKAYNLANIKLSDNIYGSSCYFGGDIDLSGSKIDGDIYLIGSTIKGNLYLNDTIIEGDLILEDLELEDLILSNTQINGKHLFKGVRGNHLDITKMKHSSSNLSGSENESECHDEIYFNSIRGINDENELQELYDKHSFFKSGFKYYENFNNAMKRGIRDNTN